MSSSGRGLEDFFDIFASQPQAASPPPQHLADSCLRSTAAALVADVRAVQRSVGEALDGAAIRTSLVDGSVRASIAVSSGRVTHLREHMEALSAEMVAQFQHHGWVLTDLAVVASDPSLVARVAAPKKADLVAAVAEAIAEHVKSYDVAALCDSLDMPAHPDAEADPFRSKRVYVSSRLQAVEVDRVVVIARRFLEDFDDAELATLVGRYRAPGPGGAVKNLIFGSTRKPDLVLTDALSNDLALVNVDEALLYDGGIPDEGLAWGALVKFVLPSEAGADLLAAGRTLHKRLHECLSSDAERNLLHIYASRYGTLGFDQPALVPQVWLHYDPKSASQREGGSPLARQRMDFLLLLPGRRRVVLEVDGKHHYADDDGRASPGRYAEMVRADRDLRLAGYEVFRFGGAELVDRDAAARTLGAFFQRLLASD